ncbi:MAG: IS200/IS605 family transposase [Salinivirgaceae bacterium]
MSYTKLLYHIVIRTKYSRPTIPNEHADELYRYIWGYVKNKKSVLYRINGMPEHIHLFVQLHPTIAVSDFVRDLKTSSHAWLDKAPNFPDFESWGKKYCALTYDVRDKDMIVYYIKNQRKHHGAEPFIEEFRRLLVDNEIVIDEQYFMEE